MVHPSAVALVMAQPVADQLHPGVAEHVVMAPAYKVWIGAYTRANEGREAHLRVTAQ